MGKIWGGFQKSCSQLPSASDKEVVWLGNGKKYIGPVDGNRRPFEGAVAELLDPTTGITVQGAYHQGAILKGQIIFDTPLGDLQPGTYTGDISPEGNLPHGVGTYEAFQGNERKWPCKDMLVSASGKWKNGVLHGEGRAVYRCENLDDESHFWTVARFPLGEFCKITRREDIIEAIEVGGKGHYVSKRGCSERQFEIVFNGSFENGDPKEGVFSYFLKETSQKITTQGSFINGKLHGFGKIDFGNGFTFESHFNSGGPLGKGVYSLKIPNSEEVAEIHVRSLGPFSIGSMRDSNGNMSDQFILSFGPLSFSYRKANQLYSDSELIREGLLYIWSTMNGHSLLKKPIVEPAQSVPLKINPNTYVLFLEPDHSSFGQTARGVEIKNQMKEFFKEQGVLVKTVVIKDKKTLSNMTSTLPKEKEIGFLVISEHINSIFSHRDSIYMGPASVDAYWSKHSGLFDYLSSDAIVVLLGSKSGKHISHQGPSLAEQISHHLCEKGKKEAKVIATPKQFYSGSVNFSLDDLEKGQTNRFKMDLQMYPPPCPLPNILADVYQDYLYSVLSIIYVGLKMGLSSGVIGDSLSAIAQGPFTAAWDMILSSEYLSDLRNRFYGLDPKQFDKKMQTMRDMQKQTTQDLKNYPDIMNLPQSVQHAFESLQNALPLDLPKPLVDKMKQEILRIVGNETSFPESFDDWISRFTSSVRQPRVEVMLKC